MAESSTENNIVALLVKLPEIAFRLTPSAAFARLLASASTRVIDATPSTSRLSSASAVDVDISAAAVSSIAYELEPASKKDSPCNELDASTETTPPTAFTSCASPMTIRASGSIIAS